jgi:capsular polysaccharide transport system permease protein
MPGSFFRAEEVLFVEMGTITKQTSWEIQRSVIFAVFIRELNTRFGRFRLGYLWAILEPLAMIGVLSAVRVLFGTADIAGLSFPVFFATGVLAYLVFNHIINSSLGAVEANLGLFNYQRVKPADVLVARALLELLIALATAAVIFPGLYWMGFTFTWNDTLQVVATVLCLFGICFGLGLVCGMMGPLWQESKKVIPVVIRPLFFISGIFFPANILPEEVRSYALLNPLLHVIELLRGSMFQEYQSAEGSLFYILCWALGALLFGLYIYRIFRVKVVTSGSIR